jgi:nickel-dependent lactate racemase
VRPYAEVRLDTKFKTIVTSSAGYPLDKTYYQTVKGMVGAIDILEPGGDLIIVSACSEGIGSPEYAEAQVCLTNVGPENFLRGIIEKRYAAVDEWQTEMQVKAMKRANIFLYTDGLTKDQQALTGVTMIKSPAACVMESVKARIDRRVAVIPEGPYVIPLQTLAAAARRSFLMISGEGLQAVALTSTASDDLNSGECPNNSCWPPARRDSTRKTSL